MTSSRPYPYIAPGRTIRCAPEHNEFILAAKEVSAQLRSLYPNAVITSAVLVSNGRIIGRGTNNPVHRSFCPRTAFHSRSGEDYELCPKHCHPDNHAEPTAIRHAMAQGHQTAGADLYLYGHWWLCKPCWDTLIASGIRDVYLVEGAAEKFFQAVSRKGEPERLVRVRINGALPDAELTELLRRVNVELVGTADTAEFTFAPLPGMSREAFVLGLSQALAESGIYER